MRLALVLLPLCYGFIPTQPRRPSQLSVTRQQAEEWVQDVVDEVISQSSTHREDDPYHAAAAAADDDADDNDDDGIGTKLGDRAAPPHAGELALLAALRRLRAQGRMVVRRL